jgi:hypothetical protein
MSRRTTEIIEALGFYEEVSYVSTKPASSTRGLSKSSSVCQPYFYSYLKGQNTGRLTSQKVVLIGFIISMHRVRQLDPSEGTT